MSSLVDKVVCSNKLIYQSGYLNFNSYTIKPPGYLSGFKKSYLITRTRLLKSAVKFDLNDHCFNTSFVVFLAKYDH